MELKRYGRVKARSEYYHSVDPDTVTPGANYLFNVNDDAEE